MKKFLSVLLVVTLLAGMFVFPVSADDTPVAGTVLYEQDFENVTTVDELGYTKSDSANYPGTITLALAEAMGTDNTCLSAKELDGGNWALHQMVPASAVAGIDAYTISYKMELDYVSRAWHNMVGVRIGEYTSSSASGTWVTTYYPGEAGWKLQSYNASSASVASGSVTDVDTAPDTKVIRNVQITVDNTNSKVVLYVDGTAMIKKTGCQLGDGMIHLMMYQAAAYIDDICVTVGGIEDAPAVETEGTLEVLYTQDFENTTATDDSVGTELGYTVASTLYPRDNNMSIAAFGEGNKALLVDASGSTYGCYSMVPASLLAGVTKYTVEFTMQQDGTTSYNNDMFGIRFGQFDAATAVGEWVVLRSGNSWKMQTYNEAGSSTEKGLADFTKFAKATIKVEVDSVAKTVKLYRDGTLIATANEMGEVVGGIYWMFAKTKVYIDDVTVYSGIAVSNNTQGEEDDREWPVRPEADYTGKTAGEVIFSDNFDNAQSTEDLYWQPVESSYFNKKMIDVELANAINDTTCVKVTGGASTWGAFEIVPAAVLDTYDVYTVHMTLNAASLNNRFSLFYNTPSTDETANCGLLEIRWNPMIIRNQGIVNGTSNSYTDDPTAIGMDTNFTIAIEINRTTGITTTYVNGEFFNVGLNINTAKSALYLVAQDCEVYMDDLMVTAGTYSDYADDGNTDEPGNTEEPGNTQTPGNNTTDNINTETNAPETQAPTDNKKSGGCKGVVSLGSAVVMAALGAACLVIDRKKRSVK